MYVTEGKRVYKSKRCVLFMTFRPSQRTLFMARHNWVSLALIHNFKPLAIFCGCTTRFVMEQVRNPGDRFSHNEAHIFYSI